VRRIRIEPRRHEDTKGNLRDLLFRVFVASWFIFGSTTGFAGTAPATQPSDQIATWFAELSNRDPKVREQARIGLMGISRDDLRIVRRLVDKSRPLAPSQATALHEIVAHVFLTSQPYEAVLGRTGFLGVQFEPTGFNPIDPNANDEEQQVGVVVIKRMPGFCAYRHLLDGDVIVGAAEAPNQPIRKAADLTQIITSLKGGDTVHLQVLRGGQQIEIAIPLDASHGRFTSRFDQSFIQLH